MFCSCVNSKSICAPSKYRPLGRYFPTAPANSTASAGPAEIGLAPLEKRADAFSRRGRAGHASEHPVTDLKSGTERSRGSGVAHALLEEADHLAAQRLAVCRFG